MIQREVPEYPGQAEREELVRIEELIKDLDVRLDTTQGFMREHLMAARGYLIGAMPEEYRMTLKMARQYLPQIEDAQLKARLGAFLRE